MRSQVLFQVMGIWMEGGKCSILILFRKTNVIWRCLKIIYSTITWWNILSFNVQWGGIKIFSPSIVSTEPVSNSKYQNRNILSNTHRRPFRNFVFDYLFSGDFWNKVMWLSFVELEQTCMALEDEISITFHLLSLIRDRLLCTHQM